MSSLRDEIEEINRKFVACYSAGDFTAVSNFYTEDCRFMAPGCPMVTGRDATAKMFQTDYESGFKTLKLVEEEIGEAGGDVIYSRGEYRFYTADGKEGEAGKYIYLWKRVNGQLFLYTDVFNTNKP